MAETKGQFKNGVWVVEPETPAAPEPAVIDKRFTDATKSVISSIDDVMKVTHDLVTTEEGKQYIEKTIKDTQTQIQKSFDEIMGRVKTEMDKKVNEINKTVNDLNKKVKSAK